MHNHFLENRDRKILLIPLCNLDRNWHYTCDELGQTAPTKLNVPTGAVLSMDQQTHIFFSPFQLLVLMVVYSSNWI